VVDQPEHCDEPWLIQLNGPTGTEPVVLNLTPADGVTPPALQVNGAPVNANTLNLSNLLGADAAPTQLTATGTVQQGGQAFTFQVDATLQAMIDQQHLQHATMS
jgi:hypothetical protein